VLATIESLCGNISDLMGNGEDFLPPNSGLLDEQKKK
jgi:hypothetical protein